MKSRYFIVVHILFLLSLAGNVGFFLNHNNTQVGTHLLKETSNQKNYEIPQKKSSNRVVADPVTKKRNAKLLSVYVLPHPPDFLKGKTIFFHEYSIRNINGTKKVVFVRYNRGKSQETIVEEEAIRWH